MNVLGSGSGGASSGGQVSACAGIERPSLFSGIQEVAFQLLTLLRLLWPHWVQ